MRFFLTICLAMILAVSTFGISGCSQQQLVNAAKINTTVEQSMTDIDLVQADTTLTKAEKWKKIMEIVVNSSTQVGLIPPEQQQNFQTALDTAWSVYYGWQPAGAVIDKKGIALLITLAIVFLKKSTVTTVPVKKQ